MKITKNTSCLLKSPEQRLGQHVYTLLPPMFTSTTAGFLVNFKNCEKPNFYNQHFWLNYWIQFLRNTFLSLCSLSTILLFPQVEKIILSYIMVILDFT